MSFTKLQFEWAKRVADFMIKLSQRYPERYDAAERGIPFGDMAYGSALEHWHAHNCPKDAWFSYEESQTPCPILMEFRKEISAEFGLSVFTVEEAKNRAKLTNRRVVEHHVKDWGLN